MLAVLKFIWRWKAWLLAGVLILVIGIQHYTHKKAVASLKSDALKLEAVISSTGIDLQTCKGNLALCEQSFKDLSSRCRTKCPSMSSDIDALD